MERSDKGSPSRIYRLGTVRTKSKDSQRKQLHAYRQQPESWSRGPRIADWPAAVPPVWTDAVHLLQWARRSRTVHVQRIEDRARRTVVHCLRRREARTASCDRDTSCCRGERSRSCPSSRRARGQPGPDSDSSALARPGTSTL